MTARQVRRQEERKARKEAFKAQKQTEQLGETAAPPSGAPPSGRLESDRTTINRANAQLSTGPKTPEGKRISSRNSFKHGLYSRQLILAGEDPSELDALRDDLRREHQPATPTEDILVNELAEHYWRLRRMRKFEARAMGAGTMDELHKALAILPIIQRTMAAAERGFHKALKTLTDLQRQRAVERKGRSLPVLRDSNELPAAAAPGQTETGFVSQNTPSSAKTTPLSAPQAGFVSQDPAIVDRDLSANPQDLVYAEAA